MGYVAFTVRFCGKKLGVGLDRVAVMMSVYKGDRLGFLIDACDSVLNAAHKNIEFHISVDGPVSDDVRHYLKRLEFDGRERISVGFYDENMGLAFRLNQLIEISLKGDADFFARMDADDISHPLRFSEQIEYLKRYPDVDVLGTGHVEIDENNIKQYEKIMPESHDELLRNIIKRCPFNHPTVMFRRSVFERTATRYKPSLQNTQDYYYWVDLLSEGFRFGNINKPLLQFRVDHKFYKRRGAKKALNDFKARVYAMNRLKCRSFYNLMIAFGLVCLRLSPSWLKVWAYRKLR